MKLNPNEIFERYRIAGEAWANLDGAACLLEETRKSVRAQIMTTSGETSVSKAEMYAEADEEYRVHLERMVEARTQANIARVNYDAIRAWVDLTRSAEASNRAMATLR